MTFVLDDLQKDLRTAGVKGQCQWPHLVSLGGRRVGQNNAMLPLPEGKTPFLLFFLGHLYRGGKKVHTK